MVSIGLKREVRRLELDGYGYTRFFFMRLTLSTLRHVWLIDIDGTILRHNGHKSGEEELLPGVKQFWSTIPPEDEIILLSARNEADEKQTLDILNQYGIRHDRVIFGLPTGERILINDAKPGGLVTAIAVDVKRDTGLQDLDIQFDKCI